MLVDPLPVKALAISAGTSITVSNTSSFALLDLAPGKSLRRCASTGFSGANTVADLTISHSASKENGITPTTRTLIRLDYPALSLSSDGGRGIIKAYAYLVVGAPQGAYDDDGSPLDTKAMICQLLGTFAVSTTGSALSDVNLARILAGEP
jgi:hypothetical protein